MPFGIVFNCSTRLKMLLVCNHLSIKEEKIALTLPYLQSHFLFSLQIYSFLVLNIMPKSFEFFFLGTALIISICLGCILFTRNLDSRCFSFLSVELERCQKEEPYPTPENSFLETESSFQCSDRLTVNVIISMFDFDALNSYGTHLFPKINTTTKCL